MLRSFCAFLLLPLCAGFVAAQAQYQVNQPAARLTINTAVGTSTTKAVSSSCPGQSVVARIRSTNVGLGWEGGVDLGPLLPASGGALVTGNGQIINLNTNSPSVGYLFGGTQPDFTNPIPSADFSLPFVPSTTLGVRSFQMGVVSPSNPDGIALSQGCEHRISLTGTSAITADDSHVVVDLSTGCFGANTSVSFYGVSYTQLFVGSNGRILLSNATGAANAFVATPAAAAAGDPFFGFWTDLNITLGGNISIVNNGTTGIDVDWNAVPYYGEAAAPVSFGLSLNLVSGVVTFRNLTGIPANPLTAASTNDAQFLGMSPGGGVGLGSPTTFAAGMGGSAGLAMIYDNISAPGGGNLVGSLVPGTLNQITFTPAGSGYSWAAQ